MSQKTTKQRFMIDWTRVGRIPGARFGMLNELENHHLEVEGWPEVYAPSKSPECSEFLMAVAREGTDNRDGAKALQLLLKHVDPQYWSYGDKVYQDVMVLLCLPKLQSIIHREPLARLAREFLEKYREVIWDHVRPEERDQYLLNWLKAIFATGDLNLLYELAYVPDDLRNFSIAVLEETLCEDTNRTIRKQKVSGSTRDYDGLSDFAQSSGESVGNGYWQRRIEVILYLRTIRGDFDELIPLR